MKWSSHKWGLWAVTALAVCIATQDSMRAATILFSDLGPPGNSYDATTEFNVSGRMSAAGAEQDPAMSFTPTVTGAVSSVAFAIGLISGTNSVIFDLTADNNGVPGIVIESYSFVNQMEAFGNQSPLLTATSTLNPVLDAGTTYWMVAFPGASDTYAGWYGNNQDVTGGFSASHDGGESWSNAHNNTIIGAFEVLSAGVSSPIPEPSTLALAGIGMLTLLGCAWRGRRIALPAS